MIECETTTKQWGNSIGVIIPKGDAETGHLKANQRVRVIIMPAKTVKVGEIQGLLKSWRKPTKKIMEETDKELDS